MPLVPGNSGAVVGGNIAEMEHSGYPHEQAIAAALDNARRHPRARGGAAPGIERINRGALGYVEPGKRGADNAQCITCVNFLVNKGRCRVLRAQDEVEGDWSCCEYAPGKPAVEGEPLGCYTPEQVQLVKRRVQCHRCCFFDDKTEPREHCDAYTQLQRMLPRVFDLDRYVHRHACCNLQTAGKRDPANFGPLGPIGESGEKKAERATGGLVPLLAAGGLPTLGVGPSDPMAVSMSLRQGARSFYHPGGFIHSSVAGRTDALPLAVPADSHVIPADVVSGIGEGNSLHGARLLDQMFHSGPWGVKAEKMGSAGRGLPRAPEPFRFAHGGGTDRTTEIMAAGGEYVVRPEAVQEFGRRKIAADSKYKHRRDAMKAGHDAVDDFILRARKHTVDTTRKLPGPVKG